MASSSGSTVYTAGPSPVLGVHSLPNLPEWLSPNIFNAPDASNCPFCTDPISRTEDLLWLAIHCSDSEKGRPAKHTHLYHAECLNQWWSRSSDNTQLKCELCTRPVTRFLVHARLTPNLCMWYDCTVTPPRTETSTTTTHNPATNTNIDTTANITSTTTTSTDTDTTVTKTIPPIFSLHATSSPALEAFVSSLESQPHDITTTYLPTPITTSLPTTHHFLAMTSWVATLWPLAKRRAQFQHDGPASDLAQRGTDLVRNMHSAVDEKALKQAFWDDMTIDVDQQPERDAWDLWYEDEGRKYNLYQQDRECEEEALERECEYEEHEECDTREMEREEDEVA